MENYQTSWAEKLVFSHQLGNLKLSQMNILAGSIYKHGHLHSRISSLRCRTGKLVNVIKGNHLPEWQPVTEHHMAYFSSRIRLIDILQSWH